MDRSEAHPVGQGPQVLGDARADAPRRPSPEAAARTPRVGEVVRGAVGFAFRPTRRNRLHWASWALALGVELALAAVLRDGQVYGWEKWLTRRFQEVPGRGVVFDVSSTLTNTLSVSFAALFAGIVAVVLLLGHRGAAALLLLTFPLHVLALFPKALVDRPRPSPAFGDIYGVGGGQSFPSGHSEYAVTFYGFLAYLIVLRLRRRWQRAVVLAAWVLLVLATGFGRVALGRHWPLDVLASYLIGLGLLSGMVWLHTAFRYAKRGGGP